MNRISIGDTFSWALGFVGTGIGAGILFLPVQAGLGGILCFIIAGIIAFSISYVAHRTYCKLVIDSGSPQDFPQIVQSYLGNFFALLVTILLLLMTMSYLAIYTIGFNIGLSAYIQDLNLSKIPLHATWWFPLIMVISLMFLVSLNEKTLAKIMGTITFPLIGLLLILSIYMIKFWDINRLFNLPNTKVFITGFFNNIPILIFSAIFFPPISAMVLSYRKQLRDKEKTEFYSYRTLALGQIILIGFTVFFSLSSLFSTPLSTLRHAMNTNLNIMAAISSAHNSKILTFIAPLIALIALLTSFLGFYFGTRESARNLIVFLLRKKYINKDHNEILEIVNSKKNIAIINILLGIFLYIVAIINFNIGTFVGLISVPITAFILYIIPFIIITYSRKYRHYRGFVYYTIIIGGILLISSTPIAMILKKML